MKEEIQKLYLKERNRLFGFIKNKVDNSDTAEEILQETFLSLLKGSSITGSIDNLMGYVYTIARNHIIDWYRKKKLKTVPLEGTAESLFLEYKNDISSHPEKDLYKKAVMEAILACVEELPFKQQQVFIWQMIEGKTCQEIADMTGDPLSTILSRKRYAIQFLRQELKDFKDWFNDNF